jgi:hypothetical protein
MCQTYISRHSQMRAIRITSPILRTEPDLRNWGNPQSCESIPARPSGCLLWSGRLPRGIVSGARFVILLGSPYPGVLPRNGYILIIAAKPYVGAVTVGEFERLVLSDRDRGGASETGVQLFAKGVFYAVHAPSTTEPEVAIERDPKRFFRTFVQGGDGKLDEFDTLKL